MYLQEFRVYMCIYSPRTASIVHAYPLYMHRYTTQRSISPALYSPKRGGEATLRCTKSRRHATGVAYRLFCFPILFDRCRLCSFLKSLSYRHTPKPYFSGFTPALPVPHCRKR